MMLLRNNLGALKSQHNRRFPKIVFYAAQLGVTRSHLWRVLTGERKSPGLVQRFNSLQKPQGASKRKSMRFPLVKRELKPRGKTQFHNILFYSRELGVNRSHLYAF
jgi:hypothetical protein